MGRDLQNLKRWRVAYYSDPKRRAKLNRRNRVRYALKHKNMTPRQKAIKLRKARDYYKAHDKVYHSARIKRYKLKLKMGIINAYGGKCTCCGIKDHRFLTLDHKDGRGKAHRVALCGKNAGSTSQVYRYVRDVGCPPEFTVLCFNCNIARSLFGCCPHQDTRAKRELVLVNVTGA